MSVDPATVPTWGELCDDSERRLAAAGIVNAAAEARWIVEEASGLSVAELAAARAARSTPGSAARVERMAQRRLGGEPLQYVLGSWSFRGIDVFVDQRVLIPRPETEITAQVTIDEAVRLGARDGIGEVIVVDLGTGSGAIAMALASEVPGAQVWATDASTDALAVARANLAGLGSASRAVRLAQGDWFDALPGELRGRLCVVVTNPPYVAEHEVEELAREVVEHEPRAALVSGPTGLECIERIVGAAPGWLETPGALVVEIAPHQAAAAIELARSVGFTDVRVERDLALRERVLVAGIS